MLQNSYVCLMAEYNHWMNLKLYGACSQLSNEQLSEDRGAFFGSIIGTLSHLAVADTIWLKRLSTDLSHHRELKALSRLPRPQTLNTILYPKLEELAEYRQDLDKLFLSLSKVVTDDELKQIITYKSTKGTEFKKVLFSLLVHIFNHQTHHRGQTTTLLSQAGVDIGVTDLLALIPNE